MRIFTFAIKPQNSCSRLYHSLMIAFDVVNTLYFLGVDVAVDVVHKLDVVRETAVLPEFAVMYS